MADRSVVVRLKAEVSGFQAAMAASGASAKRMQADLEQMQQHGGTALGKIAASADVHKEAWQTSGVAMLGFGAAAEAGVGLAVKAFADFGSKMAQVQSLSHASAGDMQMLSDAALNMGQSIGFSATEVADAEIELVKAGVSVKDIMGGALAGSLTLAAAGQISVADATEIATIAMTQFGLSGKDVPHVADLLAAGADKALGGVQELGWALKTGGLVAHQFGISLDDTVGTLALFAQNGLMGEAAGTDLRQMLLKLAAPSKTASEDMHKLGLSIYDSQGHFVGMTSLAGQLHDKMGKLSESERNAMEAHIFGARSIVGANILYQAGAKGVQDWINNVNDSGFAAKQAAGKMDSLSGDMSKLQAAWQTSMIEMGSTADGFLRPVIQNVTGVMRGFEALPESTKGAILGFAAVGGAALLAGGGFLSLAPKVLDTINGFKTLKDDFPKIAGGLTSVGKAASVAAAALALMGVAAAIGNAMTPAVDSIAATTQALVGLKQNAGAIDDTFKKFSGQGIAAQGINSIGDALHRVNNMNFDETLNKWFNDWSGIPDALKPARDAVSNYDQSLADLASTGNAAVAAQGFKQIADEGLKSGVAIETTAKSFPQYLDALRKAASDQHVFVSDADLVKWAAGQIPPAMQLAGMATQTFTDALGNSQPITAQMAKDLEKLGVDASGAIVDINNFAQALLNTGLANMSARDAESAFQQTLAAKSDNIKNIIAEQAQYGDALNKTGTDFNFMTKSGQDANAMISDQMRKGIASAEALAKSGGTTAEVTAKINEMRNALIDSNTKLLGNHDAAVKLTDSLLGIPPGVSVKSWMSDEALKMADQTTGALNGIPKDVQVNVVTTQTVFHNLVNSVTNATNAADGIVAADGSPGRGAGVLLPAKKAAGGAIFGPGTGTSDDIPAWLSNGEHVLTADEVQKMGGQAAVYRFRQMVDKGQLPKFARGGGVFRVAPPPVYRAPKARKAPKAPAVFFNDPGHLHESASAHANRLYREAQAAAAAHVKELAKAAAWRNSEISTLSLDSARGQSFKTVGQSLSSAYQFSDRLRTMANSGNVNSQRGFLLSTANNADATLRNLYAQSDRLTTSLTTAKQKLTDLTTVKTGVASSLSGEFKLSNVIGNAALFGVPNIGNVQSAATAKLHQIQAFGLKLNALQKMGYAGAIVQEVAGMGSEQGAVAADALIGASKSQVTQLNGTYTAIDSASNAAGIYVTNSMFKGGVSVADGIVKGLESQQARISNAMLSVGYGMEKALKKALGINSPSKVAEMHTDNFTGTIADRLKAAVNPISGHAAAIGHAMVPSKSLFGGTGATAYQPSAPAYQGAPSYRAASSTPATVTHNYYITDQSNPVATAHEVTRRQTALAV